MGLLDNVLGSSFDDPRTAATLQLAQGLLSSPRVMQGLAGGLSGYQQTMAQAKQAKMMEEMRQMQMAQQKMQMEAAQRQQAKEQGIEEDYRNAYRTPEQMAMAQNGGPTLAAANAAPQMEGGFDQKALRDSLAKRDPLMAYKLFGPKAPENMVVGGSLVQVGQNGVRELYRPPEKATPTDIGKLISEMGELPEDSPLRPIYQNAIRKATTHAPAASISYGSPVAGVDARGNPVFFQPSKDGRAPAIIQGIAPPKTDKPLTEGQAKAAAFASQMRSAESELTGSGFNPEGLSSQVEVAAAGGIGNFVVGKQAQRARQAQEQWSEAFLRFKTGAAASDGEVTRNVRTYFPQPGDSKDVIAQKARMRLQAIRDVEINAGNPQAAMRNTDLQPVAPTGATAIPGFDPDAIEQELARRSGGR